MSGGCEAGADIWYSYTEDILRMRDADISGNFLIAAPGLNDPNFEHSVVLICEHTKEGAFGFVINKVLMNSINPLLQTLGLKETQLDLPVHYGGPVRPDQGYVIYSPHDRKYDSLSVVDDIAVTASKEALHDIALGRGPERYIFALGSSGWGANQLEEELMMGSWIVAPANVHLIFGVPSSEQWRATAESIGIDFDRYCDLSGNT
jgi:putative transcriptional regulator